MKFDINKLPFIKYCEYAYYNEMLVYVNLNTKNTKKKNKYNFVSDCNTFDDLLSVDIPTANYICK